VEVKTASSELRGKELWIGISHVPDSVQTEVVKSGLGLRAGTPQAGHGKGSQPDFGFFRGHSIFPQKAHSVLNQRGVEGISSSRAFASAPTAQN
jgi:hypothetical protein